jgi:hypothetical protein
MSRAAHRVPQRAVQGPAVTTVEYPLRLVSEPNSRSHWAQKARRVKEQRSLASMVLRTRVPRPPWTVRDHGVLVVELTRIAPRLLDDDNLRGACKATRDGVADYLGVKDNDPRVDWVYRQLQRDPHEYAVRIVLLPVPLEPLITEMP